MNTSKWFDPYQVFEVEHRPCLILQAKVLYGKNITKGWADYVDTPDPYLILNIRTAPEGRKITSVKDNDVNPVWNETFTFLLDEENENIMEIALMEANYMYDETVGTTSFNVEDLQRDTMERKSFLFNGVSEIVIEMTLSLDQNPTLRYSLCLCDKEKEFLVKRKEKVRRNMEKLLGERAPKNSDEVPTLAVIGSGGGFRAMVGFSGVVKALHDSGILQCSTYLCGLSGSSWYISTLYSHDDYPEMAPGDMQEELKNNIDSSLVWLLTPGGVYRYMDRIMRKRQNGQPVSFTDFFGHMVGETLLKGRMNARLSDQQLKLADGNIPMPLLTCVHVKKDRSARNFQEWVEFSPYEIGLAKYGTFMPTELFGSKFFMGKICKMFEEQPLHFLQGIWGSAFCILFKRLLEDNRRLDPVEMIRQEMAKQLEENEQDESSDSSDDGEFDDGDGPYINNNNNNNKTPFSRDSRARVGLKPQVSHAAYEKGTPLKLSPANGRRADNHSPSVPSKQLSTRRTKQKGYWHDFLKGVFENKKFELLSTRAGRAGVIHNFMRGLSLQQSYPMSPFTPDKSLDNPDNTDGNGSARSSEAFGGAFEMHPTNVKHLYMVDGGLTFNSPYPVVLRPQREVDIILSFDFSARPSDSSPPFKELLLAAEWAKKFKVSFPPIDTTVFDREGMKELYIFKHPTDSHCPVVLHFCLVNVDFRKYVKPGVRRRTKEEIDFAKFDLFDDPSTPYSTFNFKYPHDAFDKLSKLTEFNTLANIKEIKNVMAEAVERKRTNPVRCPCALDDIPKLRRVSQKNKNRLSRFVSRVRSGKFNASQARKDIDKSMDGAAIMEEKSIDHVDAVHAPAGANKLSRQRAVTKQEKVTVIKRTGDQFLSPPSKSEFEQIHERITKQTNTPLKSTPNSAGTRFNFSPTNVSMSTHDGNVTTPSSAKLDAHDRVTKEIDIPLKSTANNAQTRFTFSPPGPEVIPTKRDIPGRRKPRQPEAAQLWHDSKCNSIDEFDDDSEQFYTAYES